MTDGKEDVQSVNPFSKESDCAVCLQKCNHPTKLPCGHIFCFLCVKGIAFQSKKCAMCRAIIPSNYLDNPVLLGPIIDELDSAEPAQDVYQWFYEGRNGWWKYDERSNMELEAAFTGGDSACTLLLAGTLYVIDFQSMTQVRRSDQTRRRHVRRDAPTFPSKGIAGIKTDFANAREKSDDESDQVIIVETVEEVIDISDDDDNNVLNAETSAQEDVSSITQTFSAVSLQEPNISAEHSQDDNLL